ncbi:MAG: LysM peptidoglycan-binding domain-containing protein [Caldilineaceae bacterium]|nr:LysM peptidoglycan-binding domain-containing protein [Caldilineaceae bacterium]
MARVSRFLQKLAYTSMAAFLVGMLLFGMGPATATAAPALAQQAQESTYVVQRGDTLFSIARRFGTTVAELSRLNGITNPNLIRVGQRLRLPTPATPPTPMPAPAAPWSPPAAQIEVLSPVAEAVYRSPIEVIGFSQTFEAVVNLRLRDEAGETIAERFTMGGSVDGFDFFQTSLRFVTDRRQNATLEVFEISAKDGSEIHKVTLPLVILPGQRSIDMDAPAVGANVCSPVSISGYSDTFEANVIVSLRQRDGTLLVEGFAMGGTLNLYRPFSTGLSHAVSAPQAVLVSAEGEEGGDATRIPVTLHPAGSARCP